MAKVFTITEGLENMGAIRTGGQGSVYKGKRYGEIVTAVKLLPTPIHTEDENDKNYKDFINEVEKLKKVNETPNPNVVKILSSGLTESGSFPFIEMEFIEGPDLLELLEAPHDPIFSISEIMKVADQLSNALAHCHKYGIKHGDIKSNNVKFNIYTGNYVLLDFGLAIMSDEQRRSSLRHAGAIEFMAPEQNDGHMLFESDVYSFGVILYELIGGRVPFPLNNKGETERNKVMLAHLESPVPDLLTLRKENLPAGWTQERKNQEMKVPEWILGIVDKCLEKKSEHRFKNGQELHDAITHSRTTEVGSIEKAASRFAALESENEKLKTIIENFKEQEKRGMQAVPVIGRAGEKGDGIRMSKPAFATMLILLLGLVGFLAYSAYFRSSPGNGQPDGYSVIDSVSRDSSIVEEQPEATANQNDEFNDKITSLIDSTLKSDTTTNQPSENTEGNTQDDVTQDEPADNNTEESNAPPKPAKYTLAATRAFFYENPDEGSRTNNFLSSSNRAELTAIDDRNGYIYVVFFANNGQVIRGWLRKRDLRRINQ